jgi:hypothetical protein
MCVLEWNAKISIASQPRIIGQPDNARCLLDFGSLGMLGFSGTFLILLDFLADFTDLAIFYFSSNPNNIVERAGTTKNLSFNC